jgi:hypothetical protein
MDHIKLVFTYRNPILMDRGGGSVTGEGVWAFRLTDSLAIIDNVPIGTDALAAGDVVEFDPAGHVVAILHRIPWSPRSGLGLRPGWSGQPGAS